MLNILVAYPYIKPNVIELLKNNSDKIRFLLDSGAFTAWKANKTISLDEYCNFIDSLPFKPWRYFTLDVIGNPKKSLENYNEMLKRGYKPIPIFTRGEDISMIDEYYKTSDVIGVGGLVGTKKNKGFVKAIMNKIGNRKVHWLGFNKSEFIAHYRPYMCDSSSWSATMRYAVVKIYDKNGIWHNSNKKDFINKPNKEIIKLIISFGINPSKLSKKNEWINSGRGLNTSEVLTYRSWTKYQLDVKDKLGINFFLACASDWQIKLMLESYNYWIDNPNLRRV